MTISPKKNIQTLYNGFQDWQPHVKKLHYEAFRVGKFSWGNEQTSENASSGVQSHCAPCVSTG